MILNEEITCPSCKKIDTDPVPYVYKTLRSKGAGRNLFDESLIASKTQGMTEDQKQKLLKRLTPPEEPKTSLPAGAIALMAFLVSWLTTGSLIMGRLGKTTYFAVSITATLLITIQFFTTLRFVVRKFTRDIIKYRKIKSVWNKQYLCNNCHHIFIPNKNR